VKRIFCSLPLLAIGCAGPTIVGNWTAENPGASAGENSMFEFSEKGYKLTTVMANHSGKDFRVTTSGTYTLVENTLTFTPSDAQVNNSQIDNSAILKYAAPRLTSELRFIGKDKAELIGKNGQKITLARTSTSL
jgi:hypothetical protein